MTNYCEFILNCQSKNIIKIREQKIDEKGVLFVQNSDNSNEKVYYLNGNQHIVRYDGE